MTDVFCYDTQGNALEFLTQWDLNRVVVIHGIDLSLSPRVKFSNKLSKTSLVVRPVVTDDRIYVDIPNILLQEATPLIVAIFYEYDDRVRTQYIFTIPIIPSKRPEDYAMTDNVDYVNWIEIQERAETLLEEIAQERDEDILFVSSVEPELTDVIWFDTSFFE